MKNRLTLFFDREDGSVAIMIAICLFVFAAFAALAVDLGHLYVVRNELQNAADAGALAGARVLYVNDGTSVNVGANQIAHSTAESNNSDNAPVEVEWTSGNGPDVQRGHWRFSDRTFTANDSTTPVDLWNATTAELDANLNFINAIRVVTRRQANPVVSFFARIFGYESFAMSAEAIAYIGFAGDLLPGEADQPIAICAQSIRNEDGEYDCSIGRMLNSGSDDATNNTAGWTNFTQPCETANANQMNQLVCGDGNPEMINYGEGTGATGGVQQSTFDNFRDCWIYSADSDGDGNPDQPWEMTLPVIDCPGNNVSNCAELRGAVTLVVVWITTAGTPDINAPPPPEGNGPPTEMGDWSNSSTDGETRWLDFVDHFNLKNANNDDAPFAKKSIYFLPDCTPHDPSGVSGGENFGVLAKIPVLVK